MAVRALEGVVMDEHPVAGDVSAVAAVAPTVHVEMVTRGIGQNQVPGGLVAGAGSAAGGDVVAAIIELVGDDVDVTRTGGHPVAETAPLGMVDEVVVDLAVDGAVADADGGDIEVVYLAIVNRAIRLTQVA